MFTYNLTHIDIFTWIDEELTTVLQLINSVGKGITGFKSNHRTVGTALDISLIGLILLETVSHDSLTLRSGQHIGTQTDDTT